MLLKIFEMIGRPNYFLYQQLPIFVYFCFVLTCLSATKSRNSRTPATTTTETGLVILSCECWPLLSLDKLHHSVNSAISMLNSNDTKSFAGRQVNPPLEAQQYALKNARADRLVQVESEEINGGGTTNCFVGTSFPLSQVWNTILIFTMPQNIRW